MTKEMAIYANEYVKNKIYTIRGVQVMLDSDLAEFYGVAVKRLNEQVNRNAERFPPEFMFQLTDDEYDSLRSQFVILNTTSRGRHRKYLPYAFTEQGVAIKKVLIILKICYIMYRSFNHD